MKTWGILAIAMTLAAAVFGFRHREWKSLQKRAQAVRQASPPPAAGPESAGRTLVKPDQKALTKLHEVAQTINAPIEALPRLRNRPEEEQAELMAAALNGVHSAEDARAFAAALLDWPAAEPRRMALGAALKQLVTHDGFDAAAAWLDSVPDASAEQKDDARATLVMLAPSAEEMPQRVNWVVAQAAPDQQAAVAARLARDWAWQDFNAAGAWLHENRGAPWFDAAVGAFAAIAGRIEPPTAFDWALTISDESLRRSSLHEIMRLWRNDYPEAAHAFLIASALPESWKAELAAPPPPSPAATDE